MTPEQKQKLTLMLCSFARVYGPDNVEGAGDINMAIEDFLDELIQQAEDAAWDAAREGTEYSDCCGEPQDYKLETINDWRKSRGEQKP